MLRHIRELFNCRLEALANLHMREFIETKTLHIPME